MHMAVTAHHHPVDRARRDGREGTHDRRHRYRIRHCGCAAANGSGTRSPIPRRSRSTTSARRSPPTGSRGAPSRGPANTKAGSTRTTARSSRRTRHALLRHTHFSPLGGKPDAPENYHTLTYTLADTGSGTEVTLEQDNNDGPEAAEHAAGNWRTMLDGLKATVEG